MRRPLEVIEIGKLNNWKTKIDNYVAYVLKQIPSEEELNDCKERGIKYSIKIDLKTICNLSSIRGDITTEHELYSVTYDKHDMYLERLEDLLEEIDKLFKSIHKFMSPLKSNFKKKKDFKILELVSKSEEEVVKMKVYKNILAISSNE